MRITYDDSTGEITGAFFSSKNFPEDSIDVGEKPENFFVYNYKYISGKLVVKKEIFLKYLREKAIEEGFEFNGMQLSCDDRTQSRMMAVSIKAKEDSSFTVNWRINGTTVALDSATIISLSDLMLAHVQACFDAEKEIVAKDKEYSEEELSEEFDSTYQSLRSGG